MNVPIPYKIKRTNIFDNRVRSVVSFTPTTTWAQGREIPACDHRPESRQPSSKEDPR